MNNLSISDTTCSFVLTRGKNTGNPCARRIATGSDTFCKDHVPKIHKENTCGFILTRGNRKGERCNHPTRNDNMFCYAHDQHIEFQKCPFVLNKGVRKGQPCDRRRKSSESFCSMHKSVQQQKWKPRLETIFEDQVLIL